jgi:GNAT superfamily N-acetyltransferase
VHIERFDPRTDERRLRACHAMVVAGQPADDPNVPAASFGEFRASWAYGEDPAQIWLATDDVGEPAGSYVLELPERENRHSAFGTVVVAPPRRRQRIGTRLLAHMAGQAAAADRSLLMAFTRVGSPGTVFAAAAGARPGMLDVRRKLRVDAALHARLAGLRAGAADCAAGYSLRSWSGPTPAEFVTGVCAVVNALADAPHDAEYEPEQWDAARLRAAEERVMARGARWHSVAAIAPDGRDVAALTEVRVSAEQPDWGSQQITAVTRPHRGHRLGLLVKVAMLELLADREPALADIVTFNAEQNEHMVSVNEELGYRVSDYFQTWMYDVEAGRKLA